jgi:hypothetical protein
MKRAPLTKPSRHKPPTSVYIQAITHPCPCLLPTGRYRPRSKDRQSVEHLAGTSSAVPLQADRPPPPLPSRHRPSPVTLDTLGQPAPYVCHELPVPRAVALANTRRAMPPSALHAHARFPLLIWTFVPSLRPYLPSEMTETKPPYSPRSSLPPLWPDYNHEWHLIARPTQTSLSSTTSFLWILSSSWCSFCSHFDAGDLSRTSLTFTPSTSRGARRRWPRLRPSCPPGALPQILGDQDELPHAFAPTPVVSPHSEHTIDLRRVTSSQASCII